MYYGHMMGYGLFWPFDILWHILGIIFVLWLIVWIFRGSRRGRRWHMWHNSSALSILNERYAKGEISKEEFEERRKTLMNM